MLTTTDAKRYLGEGHFAPGSMGPKVKAAIHFLEQGGREVTITCPAKALEAFDGKAWAHMVP
jgi:carbamate kinase